MIEYISPARAKEFADIGGQGRHPKMQDVSDLSHEIYTKCVKFLEQNGLDDSNFDVVITALLQVTYDFKHTNNAS